MHRLHKRILIPVIEANPDVPVHAIATRYPGRRHGRTVVEIRLSPPLAVDPRTMSADEITDLIRDALISLGEFDYVDEYARNVKARRKPDPVT